MPLGLNPEIILAGQAPQIKDPLDQMREAAQIQQVKQQTSLIPFQRANLQSESDYRNQEVVKAKQDMADQEAFHAAMVASGGDPDKMLEIGRQTIRNPNVLSNIENRASEIRSRNEKISAAKHDEFAKTASTFADRLQGILDSKDPAAQSALWSQTATAANDLKDESGKPLFEQKLDPSQLPNPAAINSLQQFAEGSALYNKRQADMKAAEEKRQTAEDANRKRDAASRQDARAEGWNQFQGAVTDQATYTEWRDSLPKEVRNEYGVNYDANKTPDMVARKARTVKEQDTADNQARDKTLSNLDVAIQWAEQHYPGKPRDFILDKAMDRVSEISKDSKIQPGEAGGRVNAQQKKEAVTAYDKATRAEQDLYTQLDRYNGAIAAGDTYLEETAKGLKSIPMLDHIKATGKADAEVQAAKASAIEDMKRRADILRDKAANAIKDKYEHAGRLGFTGDTDVNAAVQAVQAGKYGTQQKPAGQAPVEQPAAATPTTQKQPAAATPGQSTQEMKHGGKTYTIGGVVTDNETGKQYKIKAFTPDGKFIPEPETTPAP